MPVPLAAGARLQLNAAFIPAQNPGSPVRAIYQFLDETVVPGATDYYWLEAVDVRGGASRHGPATATIAPGREHRLYLPLVAR